MSAKIIPIEQGKGPVTIEELMESKHLTEEQATKLLEDIRTLARVFLEIIFREEQEEQQKKEQEQQQNNNKAA